MTSEDITDGENDTNANVHTFDQAIELCKLAAKLNIPINPEVMCAYTYMDMEKQQAPRFDEYPELYALQNGKEWSELSLDEINIVLKAYGKFLAKEILQTGCTVENWNLGNEANFGFAGVSLGLETAVNPKLAKQPDFMRYLLPLFNTSWLENNIWKYNAKEFEAVREGRMWLGKEGWKDLLRGLSSFKLHSKGCSSKWKGRAGCLWRVQLRGIKLLQLIKNTLENKKMFLQICPDMVIYNLPC